jgi:hypothetical protein
MKKAPLTKRVRQIIAAKNLKYKLVPLMCLFSQIMFVGSVAAIKFIAFPNKIGPFPSVSFPLYSKYFLLIQLILEYLSAYS